MRREQIDIDDFLRYFKYDHLTGEFTRINGTGKCKSTSRVGCIVRGYLVIGFNYKYFLAHRLAWRLHYGEWPKNGVDHINGDKTDNRIANLRDVDHRVNCSNRHYHRDGKLVGAAFMKNKNRWKSRIDVNGKTYNLGCYATQEEAHAQYLKCLNSGDPMKFINEIVKYSRSNPPRTRMVDITKEVKEAPPPGFRWIIVDGRRRLYDFVNCVYK